MSSLKADFDELRKRIRHGREVGHASFEPIYYLVFAPERMIEVKRQTSAWVSRLKQDGWEVETFSIAEHLWELLETFPMWPLCVAQDRKDPLNWKRTNAAIENILQTSDGLMVRLEEALRALEGKKDALLLVSDLEALHPYLRIGAIESRMQGKFHVPTVFLYPGVRAGKVRLKFLGFYPEDGNYRSVHVGG